MVATIVATNFWESPVREKSSPSVTMIFLPNFFTLPIARNLSPLDRDNKRGEAFIYICQFIYG